MRCQPRPDPSCPSAWATLWGVRDHVLRSDADSGYLLRVDCQGCGGEHFVALSVLRRFSFVCGESLVFGEATRDAWRTDRVVRWRVTSLS